MNMNCKRKINLENGFGYVKRPEDADPEVRCKECYNKLHGSEQKEYSKFPYAVLLNLFKDDNA